MTSSNNQRGLRVAVLFAAMAQVLWPSQATAQATSLGTINSIVGNGAGTTTVTSGPGTVTVTTGNTRTLLNWSSFNVSNGQTYNVVFGGPGNLIVNRVFGGAPTTINGTVASYLGAVGGATGGNVWILNPSGIAIGSTGRFDVGGLLLSTLDLADADILDNNQRFNFSAPGGTGVTVAPGAVLNATAGGITLFADAINASGAFASTDTNRLVSARNLTVDFDANLGAATTLTIDTGSGQANGVIVGAGAAFNGTRNVITASGMSTGQGNVLLANPGGANDIRFNSGSVELVSRDANVVAQGVFATPGSLTVDASMGMFQGNGGPTVGGNYSITAQDFSGGVFQPTFAGGGNSFSITDTQGGLIVGNVVAPGDLSVTTLGGDLIVDGTFGSPGSQTGNVYLTSSGAITLNGAVTTPSAAGHSIWLNAGTSINQTASAITTGSLFASASSGISLQRAINYWGEGQFTNTSSGDIRATSTGTWRLLGATSAGGLHLAGTSIGIAGNVVATGDIAFASNVVLNGNTSIRSTAGGVLLDGTVDGNGGPAALTVDAANGTTITGNVGATTALSSITVNGAARFNGASVTTAGVIDLDAVTIGAGNPFAFNSMGGSFSALSVSSPTSALQVTANGIQIGTLAVGDYNSGVSRSTSLDAGAGAIALGDAYTATLQVTAGGAFNVTGALDTLRLSGAVGGAATLSGNNHISSMGPFTSNGLVLRDLNSLLIDNAVNAGAGDVRIQVIGDNLQITSTGQIRGRDVALSSNNFYNQSGADGVVADRQWVIYQAAPPLTPGYDGLDSGNTAIWGRTIDTLAPSSVSGNRYVFAFAPTLTFTTTNTSKTYGDVLSGAGLYSISGYRAGVAGAYQGDTAASVFGGAPLVTSAGFAERASVAGGPYAITIANGSLTSLNGYQFAFNSTGRVTVDPKTLVGTATTATKTYDGNASASGSIALNGIVSGDSVGATGTFTFLDKNAGAGKTVNITGATLTGTDAGNYTLSVPASTVGEILQKAITGTGTVATKTYDGNASGTGTITLTGVVAGDDLGAIGTFTFSDKSAGTGKAVTLSGVALTGVDAGNYTLSVPASLLGDILQKAISGTVTVATKTYDGSASGTGAVSLSGVVAGDDVAGSATFTFSDKNAGSGKTVTVSGATLSGADAGNYTVTLPASALGDILRKAISGTPVAVTKTYDGSASGNGTIGLTGVVAGDDVNASGTFTFADKNAGTGKLVNVTAATLGGADAGNYTLSVPASVLGDILQKVINGTAVVATKTYDGTTAGSGTVTLSGVVAGDDLGATATFTFADKNAGVGKSVIVTGVTLGGADAGNYVVNVPAGAVGDILRRAITGTVTVATKTYDGSTAATGSIGLTGAVAGDDVGATAALAFDNKNAGTGKTVNVSGAALTGGDADNYTLTTPVSATGTILQKAITGTGTVATKTYDGTTAGSGTIALAGVVAGDTVGATGSFAFADKNAGEGKLVTVSGVTLNGADAGNYTISVPASAIGEILRKSITGTATVANKTYDGTRTGTGSIALTGVVAGDSVGAIGSYTFSDANAGTAKTVAVDGVALTGSDAGNYTVVVPGSAVADILRRAITVTANPQTKPEGAADPALTYGVTQGSLVAGESLTGNLSRVAGEAPGPYAIGQGTLSATSNYQLTFVGSTLTITSVATDPTDGLVVKDDIGSVVRFLDSRSAVADDATSLEIADQRASCEGGDERGGACEAGRPR